MLEPSTQARKRGRWTDGQANSFCQMTAEAPVSMCQLQSVSLALRGARDKEEGVDVDGVRDVGAGLTSF